jgi:hypothetical protein
VNIAVPQIQKAIAQAQFLVSRLGIRDLEGQIFAYITENFKALGFNFNRSCSDFFVYSFFGAFDYLAADTDAAFLADIVKQSGILRKSNLHDSVVVAQVHEKNPAVVADIFHPAGGSDLLAYILLAEHFCGVRAVFVSCKLHGFSCPFGLYYTFSVHINYKLKIILYKLFFKSLHSVF